MHPLSELSATWSIVTFAAAAVVVILVGTRITKTADQLADRTGLGEAMAGGVLLGAVTSLPGILVSFLAGLRGEPDLALGNAIGGIAAQTVFLVVADFFYRRANLEHAAASLQNVTQCSMLVVLLTLLGMAKYMPELDVLGANLVSWLLLIGYGYGLKQLSDTKTAPMW